MQLSTSSSVKAASTNRILRGGIQRRLDGSYRRRQERNNDAMDERRGGGGGGGDASTRDPNTETSSSMLGQTGGSSRASFGSGTAFHNGGHAHAEGEEDEGGHRASSSRPWDSSNGFSKRTLNSVNVWQTLLESHHDSIVDILVNSIERWDPSALTATASSSHTSSPNTDRERGMVDGHGSVYAATSTPYEIPAHMCTLEHSPFEYALGLLVRGLCDQDRGSGGETFGEIDSDGRDGGLPVGVPRLRQCPPMIGSEVGDRSTVSPIINTLAESLMNRLSKTKTTEGPSTSSTATSATQKRSSTIVEGSGLAKLFGFVRWLANRQPGGEGRVHQSQIGCIALQVVWICARIGLCAAFHELRLNVTDEVLSTLLEICLSEHSVPADGDSHAVSLFMALMSIQWYADAMLCSPELMGGLSSSSLEDFLETHHHHMQQQQEQRRHQGGNQSFSSVLQHFHVDDVDPLHSAQHLNRVSIGVTLCVAAASFGLPQVRDYTPDHVQGLLTDCIDALIIAPLELRSSQLRSGELLNNHNHRRPDSTFFSPSEHWLHFEQRMLSRCFQSLVDLVGSRGGDEDLGCTSCPHRVYNGALSQYYWEKCRYALFADQWMMWRYCVIEVGGWGLLEQVIGLAAEYRNTVEDEMDPEVFATIFPLGLRSVRCRDTLFYFLRQCPGVLHRNWDAFVEHIPDLLRNRDSFTRRNVLDVILAASSEPSESHRLDELGEILNEYDFHMGERLTDGERSLLQRIVDTVAGNHLWDDEGSDMMSPLSESGFHFDLT